MKTYTIEELKSLDWASWQPTQRAVLCFLIVDGNVLLIRKKRGLGAGKVNGPGGKIDPGETAEQAAIRETEEEVCVRVSNLELSGKLHFQFTDGLGIECSVFRTSDYSGNPQETDEADPFWCLIDEIPYDQMWKDDEFWIPKMLSGNYFEGFFTFAKEEMIDLVLK
ncbi:MAG: 8-oxo-dGTP diphosphatase [Verrucomicrobiota bacterium]